MKNALGYFFSAVIGCLLLVLELILYVYLRIDLWLSVDLGVNQILLYFGVTNLILAACCALYFFRSKERGALTDKIFTFVGWEILVVGLMSLSSMVTNILKERHPNMNDNVMMWVFILAITAVITYALFGSRTKKCNVNSDVQTQSTKEVDYGISARA